MRHAAVAVIVASLTIVLLMAVPRMGGTAAETPTVPENQVREPRYSDVIGHLRKAAIPVRELGADGKVAVTPAADPGAYEFGPADSDPYSITLHARGELPVQGSSQRVGFEIERVVRLAEPPLPKNDSWMQGIDYVGIETAHHLKLAAGTRAGRIDLWHLLQVPVGSILIVPLKKTVDPSLAKPFSYAATPGSWVEKSDHILWQYGGEALAKFGLSAAALTGRTAVFRELEPGRWCMIVRQFSVDPDATYADYPYGVKRDDQAFQAWDGYGFGEMEFHSPGLDAGLDASTGPRELKESDQLWAFGGPASAIAALAKRLLGVDVGYLVER